MLYFISLYMQVTGVNKRQKIAREISELIKKYCNPNGALLVGKDAHSPDLIDSNSDIDMIVISDVEDLQKTGLVSKPLVENLPEGFDGYCFKVFYNGTETSLHFLNPSILTRSISMEAAYLRLFMQVAKKRRYYSLFNFEAQEYRFDIENRPINGGFEICEPFGLVARERLHIGVPKDKLLSKPIVLYEREKTITDAIDKLWENTVKRLAEEQKHFGGYSNILNALCRRNAFSKETVDFVNSKTEEYL